MDESSAYKDTSPVLTDIPRFEGAARSRAYVVGRQAARRSAFRASIRPVSADAVDDHDGRGRHGGRLRHAGSPFVSLVNLAAGLSFSIPLMLILLGARDGPLPDRARAMGSIRRCRISFRRHCPRSFSSALSALLSG